MNHAHARPMGTLARGPTPMPRRVRTILAGHSSSERELEHLNDVVVARLRLIDRERSGAGYSRFVSGEEAERIRGQLGCEVVAGQRRALDTKHRRHGLVGGVESPLDEVRADRVGMDIGRHRNFHPRPLTEDERLESVCEDPIVWSFRLRHDAQRIGDRVEPAKLIVTPVSDPALGSG
jgi:hypothetical protein